MLFDDALTHSVTAQLLPTSLLKRLHAIKYTVRRFIYDEDASAKAGRFATECADLVCENAEFALAPFPNTYIEIDLRAALEASSHVSIADDSATRLGFVFLETGEVLACAGSNEKNSSFTPYLYRRKDERDPETAERQEFLRDFMVGEVAPDLRERVATFSHRMTDIWSMDQTVSLSRQAESWLIQECRGQFKRALAALLLLNQKQTVRFVDVPTRRVISNGKAKPYLAHTVVSIDIGGNSVRGLFHIDHRSSPRRHEVRAHFVHYGILEGCSHEWELFSTPEQEHKDIEKLGRKVERWKCRHCDGLRVVRQKFDRGDASKGWVSKVYQVTSSD